MFARLLKVLLAALVLSTIGWPALSHAQPKIGVAGEAPTTSEPGCTVVAQSRGYDHDFFTPEGSGPLFQVILTADGKPSTVVPLREHPNRLEQRNAARAVMKWEYMCPPDVPPDARWARAYAPVFRSDPPTIDDEDGPLNLATEALLVAAPNTRVLVREETFRFILDHQAPGDHVACGEAFVARMPVSYKELPSRDPQRFAVRLGENQAMGPALLEGRYPEKSEFEQHWRTLCGAR